MTRTILLFAQHFFTTKIFLAVLVIATGAGPIAFAQRTTTVDAKGTLKTTGNVVTESATAPTTPAPIQGDMWFDTTANLVKVWEGSVWKTVASTAGGVSAGYKVWEFASGVQDTYMYNDLGFLTNTWAAIPFNSSPVLVNTTGNPQEFTFNADGSIGLEAGHVYRISVSLGLHKPGDSGLRLVEQGNSSNILATSIDEYTYYYDTVGVRLEAIVIPTTTANYNVEFYYGNSGTIIRTATIRYNQVIPRATFQIEVLN